SFCERSADSTESGACSLNAECSDRTRENNLSAKQLSNFRSSGSSYCAGCAETLLCKDGLNFLSFNYGELTAIHKLRHEFVIRRFPEFVTPIRPCAVILKIKNRNTDFFARGFRIWYASQAADNRNEQRKRNETFHLRNLHEN